MEKEKGKLVLSDYDLPRITRPPSHLPTFHPSPERSAIIAGPRTPTPLIEWIPRPVMILSGFAKDCEQHMLAGVWGLRKGNKPCVGHSSTRISLTMCIASATVVPCRSIVFPFLEYCLDDTNEYTNFSPNRKIQEYWPRRVDFVLSDNELLLERFLLELSCLIVRSNDIRLPYSTLKHKKQNYTFSA